MKDTSQEQLLKRFRFFLKDSIRSEVDFSRTDQNMGIKPPPIEKPYAADSTRFDLPKPGQWSIPPKDLEEVIGNRQSVRSYTPEPLSLAEIAFLLWATQGVRGVVEGGHAFRTVPSAGCRHALETYVAALNVEGLRPGVYRYLPTTHQLLFEFGREDLRTAIAESARGQGFCGSAAAVFIWTAIPYRMEWRYGLAAHKVIALDAGHVCQNLYLACGAIGECSKS